jgi:hypothetical protein
MVDYFDNGANTNAPAGEGAANAAATTANGGDVMGMDEIS